MRKKADPNMSFFEAMRGMAKTPTFLAAMSAPLIGFAVGKGEDYVTSRRNARLKTDAFKEMLDIHPHLRERDPMEVTRIYNSLHNASPNMARDPMVAGAWVDEIIENKTPGMNSHHALLNAVKDLTGIQKNVSDVERHQMTGARPVAGYLNRMLPQIGADIDQYRLKNIDTHFKDVKAQNDKLIAAEHSRLTEATKEMEKTKRQMARSGNIAAQEASRHEAALEALHHQQSLNQQADQYLVDRWARWKRTPEAGGSATPHPRAGNAPPPWMNESAGAFRRTGPAHPNEGPGRAPQARAPEQYQRRKTSAARTELGAMLRALKV